MSLFNISHASQKLISSYQKKICYYDKQQWERSLEDHIIFRAESIASSGAGSGKPRKASVPTGPGCVPSPPPQGTSSITNDLIDLDLISGAAYTMKSKSQQGWLSLLVHAVVRVLLLPLYLRWWSERTSSRLTALLLTLYILQVTSMRLYFYKGFMSFNLALASNGTVSQGGTNSTNRSLPHKPNCANEFGDVSLTEVLMPIAMMIVLGVLHTQIVGTKLSASSSSSSAAGISTSTSGDRRNSTSVADKEDCQSQHTDCSSSPMSSTTTSVESSPVSDNRHRMQARLSKMSTSKSESARGYCRQTILRDETTRNNIPTIRVHNDQKNQDIIMIDDNEYPPDSNNNNNNCCRWSSQVCQMHPSRRYSDSRNYSKNYHHPPPVSCHPRRRYSDSNNNSSARLKINQFKSSRASAESGTTLRKRRSRLRKELQFRKTTSNSYDWSTEEPHLSLSPISLKSHLYSSYYGSSFDSEGTISPMTPLTSLPGDDWPILNSDVNTSEVEEDEHHSPSVSDHLERNFATQLHRAKSASQCDCQEGNNQKTNWPPTCSSCDQNVTLPGSSAHSRNFQSSKINYRTGSSPGQKNAQEHGGHINHSNDSIPSNELKVSCSVWQHNVCQKMDLSVMDISSAIIRKVESIEHSTEYVYLGLIFSLTVALLPALFRLQFLLTGASPNSSGSSPATQFATLLNITTPNISLASTDLIQIDLFGLFNLFLDESFFTSKSLRVRYVVFVAMFERFTLSFFYFFLLCVAERTFKQRFLYSKYFSQLTRRDRAKRSLVPHFRLHKVRNLKAWLSVRSYLRRHGPHRSVDTICSTSFIIAICLLTCISLQILKDSSDTCTSRLMCWEMIFWSLALGFYIMRLMILGSRINQKYRNNLSVLITEQINLYLQLERKPHKKEALMLANHVLKLAVDLLKELESPYKISGFSANPYLYNITKVVVLSAFSAVLTEMLGFKLKLYKIKLIR